MLYFCVGHEDDSERNETGRQGKKHVKNISSKFCYNRRSNYRIWILHFKLQNSFDLPFNKNNRFSTTTEKFYHFSGVCVGGVDFLEN